MGCNLSNQGICLSQNVTRHPTQQKNLLARREKPELLLVQEKHYLDGSNKSTNEIIENGEPQMMQEIQEVGHEQ